MPVTLNIEENGRLFVLKMADPWNMDELLATYPKAMAHLNDGAKSKIYTLVDLTELKTVPSYALKGRNNPFITHPRGAEVAVVGAHQYARLIVETALKIAGFKRIRFENDLDIARGFLRDKIYQEDRVLSSAKGD